jgi:hypothetical protein
MRSDISMSKTSTMAANQVRMTNPAYAALPKWQEPVAGRDLEGEREDEEPTLGWSERVSQARLL